MHPFDLKSDVLATSDKEFHFPSRLEHQSVSSTSVSDLFQRIIASCVCTTEVSPQDKLSNLSMLGHNSTMLRLELLHIAVTTSTPL
jgi:hypothetical protein